MRTAVGPEGFVLPHITKIDDVLENCIDPYDSQTFYYFLIWSTGGQCSRIEMRSKEDVEQKRKELLIAVNQYYNKH